ncbi:MAG: flagellar basal body rod protein FlgB [Gammaproteobacteria bacterium]|nr:flagellar basal body rod protein FlgB [Gammaproteobacteria bacterium]
MRTDFNNYLGIHTDALYVQARRAEVLASNLANVDTPGYKARDIDFRQVLSGLAGDDSAELMQRTNPLHLDPESESGGYELLYRQPHQASLDGNTVEHQVEMAAYSDNAMRYLASLRFIGNQLSNLRTAIRGQ